MMASTYQSMAHHDPTRRPVAPDYNLDYSAYSYSNPSYTPLPFNLAGSSLCSNAGTVSGFNAYCSVGAAASLYIPPAYTDPRCIPALDTSRHTLTQTNSSPIVKAEEISHDDGSYGFYHVSPKDLQSQDDSHDGSSNTDVDTLMRAIQTKSTKCSLQEPTDAVYPLRSSTYSESLEQHNKGPDCFDNRGFRSRKKYQCNVASCGKVFFQKTHLEIHVRAHTGHKPFVSQPDELFFPP